MEEKDQGRKEFCVCEGVRSVRGEWWRSKGAELLEEMTIAQGGSGEVGVGG